MAEILFWQQLKGNRQGFRFVRQKVIGNYIVDFYCPDLLLAIEIDGASHGEKIKKDLIRQIEIEKQGINFLIFRDSELKNNLNEVMIGIQKWISNKALNSY